jgi:integrase
LSSPSFTRKGAAAEWGIAVENKIKRGESTARPKDITVETLAALYLGSMELERTRRKRKNGVDKWVSFFGKNTIVSHIKRSEIKAFAASLRAEGLAQSSVDTYMATLKAAFNLALDDELIATNPAAGQLEKRGSRPKQKAKRKALTHEEHERLLHHLPERHGAMFYIWPRCGLRIGELRALRWASVDLVNRQLEVVEQYQNGTGVCEPKCGSVGTVTLSRGATQALREWKLRSAQMPNPLGLVFPADQGGVLGDDYLTRKVLKPAAKLAGVEWATPHCLRHTFGSWLLAGGVTDLTYIQKQLRHASLKQTIETYLHDTNEDPHALADMVDGSGAGPIADPRKAGEAG